MFAYTVACRAIAIKCRVGSGRYISNLQCVVFCGLREVGRFGGGVPFMLELEGCHNRGTFLRPDDEIDGSDWLKE